MVFQAIIFGMEKSKLAYFTDELLRSLAIWLLSAITLRYAIKELYVIILAATAITLLVTMLLRGYYRKKDITRKKLKHTDEVMRELMTADRTLLLEKIANAINGTVEQDCVTTNGAVVYPYFYGKFPLEKLNAVYNFALGKQKKLIVLCAEISADVDKNLELFDETKVAVLDKKKTYEFLKKQNILPTCKKRAKRKNSFVRSALKKSRIKGYLSAALILVFTASFSPYSVLCIIAAAVNITMSILCETIGN